MDISLTRALEILEDTYKKLDQVKAGGVQYDFDFDDELAYHCLNQLNIVADLLVELKGEFKRISQP